MDKINFNTMRKDQYNGLESNCCQADIIGQSADGHGKCSRCKENTTPVEYEVEVNRITELSTSKGRLREGQFVEYNNDDSCQIYSIIDIENVTIFYPSVDGSCIKVNIKDINF